MTTHHQPHRSARSRRILLTLLALATTTGCANHRNTFGDAPGTNLSVNGVAIRYAHLEAPDDPAGWQPGDDVPLYVWLLNESDENRSLSGASSVIAPRVTLSTGAWPVPLPQGKWVQLERSQTHLVLHDVTEQVRGALFVSVTLEISDANETTTEATFDVEAVNPNATGHGA